MLNMKKGRTEVLTGITRLGVGAAWTTSGGGKKGLLGRIKKMVGTDLDLCCVALDEDNNPKRMAWFDNQDAFENAPGALMTSGDNRTGKGSGDDEFISADLLRIPATIAKLVFIVSAYKEGVSFSNVEGVTLSVYNLSGGGNTRIEELMPNIDAHGNASVVVKAVRQADGNWGITYVDEIDNARDRDQLLALARRYA